MTIDISEPAQGDFKLDLYVSKAMVWDCKQALWEAFSHVPLFPAGIMSREQQIQSIQLHEREYPNLLDDVLQTLKKITDMPVLLETAKEKALKTLRHIAEQRKITPGYESATFRKILEKCAIGLPDPLKIAADSGISPEIWMRSLYLSIQEKVVDEDLAKQITFLHVGTPYRVSTLACYLLSCFHEIEPLLPAADWLISPRPIANIYQQYGNDGIIKGLAELRWESELRNSLAEEKWNVFMEQAVYEARDNRKSEAFKRATQWVQARRQEIEDQITDSSGLSLVDRPGSPARWAFEIYPDDDCAVAGEGVPIETAYRALIADLKANPLVFQHVQHAPLKVETQNDCNEQEPPSFNETERAVLTVLPYKWTCPKDLKDPLWEEIKKDIAESTIKRYLQNLAEHGLCENDGKRGRNGTLWRKT